MPDPPAEVSLLFVQDVPREDPQRAVSRPPREARCISRLSSGARRPRVTAGLSGPRPPPFVSLGRRRACPPRWVRRAPPRGGPAPGGCRCPATQRPAHRVRVGSADGRGPHRPQALPSRRRAPRGADRAARTAGRSGSGRPFPRNAPLSEESRVGATLEGTMGMMLSKRSAVLCGSVAVCHRQIPAEQRALRVVNVEKGAP